MRLGGVNPIRIPLCAIGRNVTGFLQGIDECGIIKRVCAVFFMLSSDDLILFHALTIP